MTSLYSADDQPSYTLLVAEDDDITQSLIQTAIEYLPPGEPRPDVTFVADRKAAVAALWEKSCCILMTDMRFPQGPDGRFDDLSGPDLIRDATAMPEEIRPAAIIPMSTNFQQFIKECSHIDIPEGTVLLPVFEKPRDAIDLKPEQIERVLRDALREIKRAVPHRPVRCFSNGAENCTPH